MKSSKMETVISLCSVVGGGGGRRVEKRRRNIASHSQIRQFRLGPLIQPSAVLLSLFLVKTVISLSTNTPHPNGLPSDSIEFNGKGKLKYVWGDALADPKVLGPDGNPYPWELATKIASKQRNPRTLFAEEFGGADIGLINPETTRQILLRSFEAQEFGGGMNSFFGSLSHSHHHHHAHSSTDDNGRQGRSLNRQGHAYTIRGRGNKRVANGPGPSPSSPNSSPYHHYQYNRDVDSATTSTHSPNDNEGDASNNNTPPPSDGGCVPSRLCPSTYNTTAPLYGISLTSGQPVTIVQKFPDLLQQVVFQVCKTSECDVIHGECVQTYLPYLFLVIPLGPVTLTGQDYVLVESGCVCRPKYASKQDEPPPLPFIQAYNTTKARTQG
ncbi:unnamed protein product [Orchesella dallaii]|uniref:Uncharacterized protein n=1 Tax=Orchesella dallaii TaxID=48710 RepID=A0ABP1RBI6_9HEXA